MIVYKIRRKSDGLFSNGGHRPKFDKKGKIWKQKNHLASHITYLINNEYINLLQLYRDCEIVEFELIEVQNKLKSYSMDEYIKEREKIKIQEDMEYKRKFEAEKKRQRKLQYEQLKKEFGE